MTFSSEAASAHTRFIGIDIGGTKVRAIATDASLRRLAERTEATADDVVEQVRRLCAELGGRALAGVGIGVPGAVDPLTGVIGKIPNVAGLDGVDLASALAASLGIPVVVENDLVAAARAEAGSSRHPDELIAVIAAGTGVGLGIVRGGELLRGAHGAAGEIADIPIPGQGVLEDRVSATGLLAAYRAAGGPASTPVPEVLRMADAGDTVAAAAVSGYSAALALAVQVVIAVLDPSRVVLTGGLGSHPVILDELARQLGDELGARVARSTFGSDSPAHGAVLLAHDVALREAADVR